jgi:hypothetical protein
MGKPRSVFNSAVDTNRKIAKNFGQFRQNITGMSSTFRGMPANPPKVSSGETNKVGGDTEKTKVQYLESLRIDKDTRIDFSTVGGGAGISNVVDSTQFTEFKTGATQHITIGPSTIDFKSNVLATGIDFGSLTNRVGDIFCNDVNIANDLTVDDDVVLGSSTTADTIQINGLFTAQLNINGQNMFFDVDRDSKIYSGSDDSIKIVTGGSLRMELNNTGVGIPDSLQVDGDVTLANAITDTITINTQIDMGGNDLDFSTGGTIDFFDIDTSSHSSGGAPALPAQPTAYFIVKYNGATRYIPYYS